MSAGVPGNPPRCSRTLLLAGVLLAALTPASARAQTGGDCEPSPTTLCLLDDRFQVEVEWHDFSGNPLRLPGTPDSGAGQAVNLPATNSETGYFWYFDANNVDLIMTVIDARHINGHFWIFAAPLTNVEYTIRVVDTQTDTPRTYFNPPGHLTIVTDTNAFSDDSNKAGSQPLGLSGDPAPAVSRAVFLPEEALPSCADPQVACVQGGRFAVHVEYEPPNPGGPPPDPKVALETATSALIDLFGRGDPPFVGARVVDGRAIDGRFWIFVSTTSLVPGLSVTVTDLETQQAVTYSADDQGLLAFADNDPFAPDPPSDEWLTTPAIPGFRFQVRLTGGGNELPSRQEADCIPETLCISGAVPGRSELFLRMVGPKPNGFLWPNLVKFSTSQIEVWIEQLSTGQVNYYKLDAPGPASSDLTGFFDRRGFAPLD